MRLVKEQTEVCKNNPQLLPSISGLEFPKQFTTHLILKRYVESISEFFHVVFVPRVSLLLELRDENMSKPWNEIALLNVTYKWP